MAPPKKDRRCSIDGCNRKHAAHDLCLMHYKRQQKHGSPEYRWGGKVVGRACKFCDRPVTAKEMCWRHYLMNYKHSDPLYADKKKTEALPNGVHARRGYLMECPVVDITKAAPSDATVEKGDRRHAIAFKNHGLRDGSQRHRRQWVHRKVAKAKPGDIVHHVDGDPRNNAAENLHIFKSPAAHAKAHRSLEKVAYQLLRDGHVEFVAGEGVYKLRQSSDLSKPSPEQP